MKIRVTAGILAATALLTAAPAHADTAGFYNELDDMSVPYPPDNTALGLGVQICKALRSGLSATAVINVMLPYHFYSAAQDGKFMLASVDQICPDERASVLAEARAVTSGLV